MEHQRQELEKKQVFIYFAAVVCGAAVALLLPGIPRLESAVNPALALMLYVTFLQVPMSELTRAFGQTRFLIALLLGNFLVIPLFVAVLVQLLPNDPMIRLGVLLVLLTPCIDYVVTFSHLGRADARVLLAATPVLLLAQMVLLPVYLRVFLGEAAANIVHIGPFVDAFLWLIAGPLLLAALTQLWAGKTRMGAQAAAKLAILPVPATALVLFVVIAAVTPKLGAATEAVLRVTPIYIAFAICAPTLGWLIARLLKVELAARRAVAFSTATRNSLVVLPLALAVPGAIPVLPAVIVTQTLVELLAELAYVRVIGRWGQSAAVRSLAQ